MLDIKNKWVLVTGASRGVAVDIAKKIASLGGNLFLQSRSKAHAEKNSFSRERIWCRSDCC